MLKKAFIGTIVIVVALVLWNQWDNRRRFNPPGEYDYITNQSVDMDYFDKSVVDAYFLEAEKVGQFARNMWGEDRIDVRYVNSKDLETQQAVQIYEEKIAALRVLESKLLQSNVLKEQGATNADIAILHSEGMTAAGKKKYDAKIALEKRDMLNFAFIKQRVLRKGDKGQRVWSLQKALIDGGADIPLDAIFSIYTEGAVKNFQEINGLFVTGQADELTVGLLFNIDIR